MKAALVRVLKAAADHLPDALMFGGAVLVSIGAGQVYGPAGWIVAGVFSMAAGVVLARGGL